MAHDGGIIPHRHGWTWRWPAVCRAARPPFARDGVIVNSTHTRLRKHKAKASSLITIPKPLLYWMLMVMCRVGKQVARLTNGKTAPALSVSIRLRNCAKYLNIFLILVILFVCYSDNYNFRIYYMSLLEEMSLGNIGFQNILIIH